MIMRPVYSKKGCNICKRRKKKCDEVHPVCGACQRNGLPCSYAQTPVTARPTSGVCEIGTFQLVEQDPSDPVRNPRLLPFIPFRQQEASVIARIPASVVRFYCPTSDDTTRDTGPLMQMTLSSSLVRHALVACFSTILPAHTHELGTLDREALGSALQLTRNLVRASDIDAARLATLLVAVMFLGLIESAGPGKDGFEMMHFLAMSTLMGQVERKALLQKLPLSQSLLILISEAILYHYAIAGLFTMDLGPTQQHWRKYRIGTLYQRVIPNKKDRLRCSPLMGGQYRLWVLAYETLCFNRHFYTVEPEMSQIHAMQAEVKYIRATLDEQFAGVIDAGPAERHCMAQIYHLHCVALLIALCALESPTPARARKLDALTGEGVTLVATLKQVPICLAPVSWSWMILALAISSADQRAIFIDKIMMLRPQMDAGHMRRLDTVLRQIRVLRKLPRVVTAQELPGELYLLQQADGVLSRPRRPDECL